VRLLPAEQSRHLVREPAAGQSISRILQSLTVAHTWHDHRAQQTSGHVWPGRFQSPVAATGEHLLTVCRCVERNPLRAGLVTDLADYPWSSYPAHGLGRGLAAAGRGAGVAVAGQDGGVAAGVLAGVVAHKGTQSYCDPRGELMATFIVISFRSWAGLRRVGS